MLKLTWTIQIGNTKNIKIISKYLEVILKGKHCLYLCSIEDENSMCRKAFSIFHPFTGVANMSDTPSWTHILWQLTWIGGEAKIFLRLAL